MKLSLPLAIGILALTLQHRPGILSEHRNSSAGRSMYGLITRKLWLTPMTFLPVLQLRLVCDLCHFPVRFPLELSDLPRETMSHLEEIQRESPLVAGIADVLEILAQDPRYHCKEHRTWILHCISLRDNVYR